MNAMLAGFGKPDTRTEELTMSPYADRATVEQLVKAVGDNALLNSQVAEAMAKRLMQAEDLAREASVAVQKLAKQMPLYAERSNLEQLSNAMGGNALLNSQVAEATAKRLLQVESTAREAANSTRRLAQQVSNCAPQSQVDQLTNAVGENALLNSQVAGATANRLLQVEKTAQRLAQQMPLCAEQSALTQFTKAVEQTAELQAKVAEATATRLLEVENTVQRIEKLMHNLEDRLDKLSRAQSAGF